MMSFSQMAAGTMVEATASAMKGAANNPNGAFAGFVGMNAASNAGGIDVNSLLKKNENKENKTTWTCSCGQKNDGLFCSACGKKRETETKEGWVCSCGTKNYGKFCTECGAKKPEKKSVVCSKCGYVGTNTLKFCPMCGNKFSSGDKE